MLPLILGCGTLRLLVQARKLSVGLKPWIQECVYTKVFRFSPQVSMNVGKMETPTNSPLGG